MRRGILFSAFFILAGIYGVHLYMSSDRQAVAPNMNVPMNVPVPGPAPAGAGADRRAPLQLGAFGTVVPGDPRQTAWRLVSESVLSLQLSDQANFPGIQAWLVDYGQMTQGIDPNLASDRWPSINVDVLVTRNPRFWQAYYEIDPAEPGLMLLHAGLLLLDGESTRASHVLLAASQRPGLAPQVQLSIAALLATAQEAKKKSDELVEAGVRLYDQGDYAGAVQKHQEALTAWPRNAFAFYELGLTLRMQEYIEAGETPPANPLTMNEGKKLSPRVAASFARARRHDPWQLAAYQGDDRAVVQGLVALAQKGSPAWKEVAQLPTRIVDDAVLTDLAAALQEAGVDDLALATKQVLAARRGKYDASDLDFIAASLNRLAPGKHVETIVGRLNNGQQPLRKLAGKRGQRPARPLATAR